MAWLRQRWTPYTVRSTDRCVPYHPICTVPRKNLTSSDPACCPVLIAPRPQWACCGISDSHQIRENLETSTSSRLQPSRSSAWGRGSLARLLFRPAAPPAYACSVPDRSLGFPWLFMDPRPRVVKGLGRRSSWDRLDSG